ncbi:MAG: Zn-dependent hydrolase [Planctomycetes bacterium]|nr:Zn-dependent hydrolase [Planctomycetota bacterium]
MSEQLTSLRINRDRFRSNFKALALIGAAPEGGVHRPALSEAHLKARRLFLELAEKVGLDTKVDGAGNHSAFLASNVSDAPILLMGSHLDSVPHGGRFDGSLGVLAALEVLQVIKENEIDLNVHLEAIDFTDEEGRFVSLMGSRALIGELERNDLLNICESRELFQQALTRAQIDESSVLSAGRDPSNLAGYLELHIEQGTRLLDQGKDIGIVTTIVGIRSWRLRFLGRADHAGTTPMAKRLDAAQGAAAFTLAAREMVMKEFPDGVVNVGLMEFSPGAFNVVPETVNVSLQFRADQQEKMDRMEAALLLQAAQDADRFSLRLETEKLEKVAPVEMNPQVQNAIAQACQDVNLSHTMLPSGAGHDAQTLAPVCPTGMIFVPSVDGFSHSPQEFTEWDDCYNGVNTLLHSALILAQQKINQ